MQQSTTRTSKGFIILYFLISFISLVISIVVLFSDLPPYYSWMPILPLLFFVLSFFATGVFFRHSNNIAYFILLFLMFIRYCVSPLLLVIGGYVTSMKIGIDGNGQPAIFLMAYELVAIFTALIMVGRRSKQYVQRQARKHISLKLIGFFIFIMTAYCIIVMIAIPESRLLFSTIFNLSDDDFTTATFSTSMYDIGSLKRSLITLFSMVFDIIRILLPAWLLYVMESKHRKDSAIVYWAFIFACIQFVFISSTFAKSILAALTTLLVVTRLCPKKKAFIARFSVFGVVSIILLFFTVRFSVSNSTYQGHNTDTGAYISMIVNAYLTGVDNVAAGFNLSESSKWSTFLFNIYGAIPFNSTLFGLPGTKLQTIYNSCNGSYGQIIPTISAGYYYFGAVLAPVFSVILTWIAAVWGEIALQSKKYWKSVVYTFGSIVFSLGIAMYNETIVLSWFTSWILPLLILSWFCDDEINE